MEAIISVRLAEKIQREYVCQVCWGRLEVVNYDKSTKTAEVECQNPNCDGGGFVTKHYAEKQRAENKLQARDFIRICGESVGIEKKRMTKDEMNEAIEKMWV